MAKRKRKIPGKKVTKTTAQIAASKRNLAKARAAARKGRKNLRKSKTMYTNSKGKSVFIKKKEAARRKKIGASMRDQWADASFRTMGSSSFY